MKKQTIAKSVFGVILVTLITKIIGFLKSVCTAGYLGATEDTDVFYLALGLVIGVTYSIFTAISVSFIPVYHTAQENGEDEADIFTTQALGAFSVFSFVLMICVIIFARPLAKGLLLLNSSLPISNLAYYIRVLSPIFFIGCINTILGAVLEANKSFTLNKSLGLIISVSTITLLVLFSNALGAKTLAYGYLIGYFTQLLLLVYNFKKYNTINISAKNNKNVVHLYRLLVPLLIGNGIYEINKLVDKVLAAGVGIGGPSALSYGQTLFDSLCALTITSTVSVLFSYTSEMAVAKDYDGIKKNISDTISVLLIVTVPFALLLITDGTSIVRFIYERGAFDQTASTNTANALLGYAIGIPFLVFREVLAKAHYAFQNSKDPMRNSIIAVIINICLSIILSRFIGISGITVATSVSYIVCSQLLNITIKKSIDFDVWRNKRFYSQMAISILCTLAISLAIKSLIDYSKLRTIINTILSFSVYFGALYISKCEQLYQLKNKFIKPKG